LKSSVCGHTGNKGRKINREGGGIQKGGSGKKFGVRHADRDLARRKQKLQKIPAGGGEDAAKINKHWTIKKTWDTLNEEKPRRGTKKKMRGKKTLGSTVWEGGGGQLQANTV